MKESGSEDSSIGMRKYMALAFAVGLAVVVIYTSRIFFKAFDEANLTKGKGNLRAIAQACEVWCNETHKDDFPLSPLELVPKYIPSLHTFDSPRYPEMKPAFVYISGLNLQDSGLVLLYEQIPKGKEKEGRLAVLVGTGIAEKLTEPEFQEKLKATQETLEGQGRTFTQIFLEPERSKP